MIPIQTEKDARSMLVALATVFKVPVPKLRWSERKRKRSHYRPDLQRITTGPNVWTGPATALVHEFAHHLQHSMKLGGHHDDRFWQILWMVADVWYPGGAKEYPWYLEYKVGRFLVSKGFLTAMEAIAYGRKEPVAEEEG